MFHPGLPYPLILNLLFPTFASKMPLFLCRSVLLIIYRFLWLELLQWRNGISPQSLTFRSSVFHKQRKVHPCLNMRQKTLNFELQVLNFLIHFEPRMSQKLQKSNRNNCSILPPQNVNKRREVMHSRTRRKETHSKIHRTKQHTKSIQSSGSGIKSAIQNLHNHFFWNRSKS